MAKVYFDHNATTPIAEGIGQSIAGWLQEWGNPSSIHWAGRVPKLVLRETREKLAIALKCHPLEIVFTSGGSESNNLAIHGIYENALLNGVPIQEMHFITSTIEHPSVLKTFQNLEKLGARVDYVSVGRDGEFNFQEYEKYLNAHPKTLLVSVQLANNEVGIILPIQKIAQKAHEFGALMHSDVVQAYGKIPLNLKELELDLATISAHKFYALKGTGVLFVKKNTSLNPIVIGGGQERRRRGGTENVLGIQALGWMADYLPQVSEMEIQVRELTTKLEQRVLTEINDVVLNAANAQRLPNTSSFLISGIDGETLLMRLDLAGFAVSTGAACSSGSPEPSPVLLALGLSRAEAQSSLRVSLGWETTESEVEQFVNTLKEVVAHLRSINTQMDKAH